MIHAASRAALATLRERLNGVLDSLAGGSAACQALGGELYRVADLLASQPRLRRTLGDPSTDASARSDLVRSLLSGKISDDALTVVADAVALRWSSPWDLTDSLEIIADDLLLAGAERDGKLDEVEDELFRFERILSSAGELTSALDESAVSADRRRALLESVLAGKVDPTTVQLLAQAVSSGRKRSITLAIDDLLQASAARRERSVARVISASELTPAQTERLEAALSDIYARPISVRSAVDPSVRGGLVVRVGDEVIDGTVATRLAAARAALAS